MEYKGGQGRLVDFSIKRAGRTPIKTSFIMALRPYGVLPLVIDLYNRKCQSYCMEYYQFNEPHATKLEIAINVKEFLSVSGTCIVGSECKSNITSQEPEYFGDFNAPMIFYNAVATFDNNRVKATNILISLIPERKLSVMLNHDFVDMGNSGVFSIALHNHRGDILYGYFKLDVEKNEDIPTLYNIKSFKFEPYDYKGDI